MKRILIIEDMAVIREPMAIALRAHGYEVATASNGQEALELLNSTIDLVLLDLAMPVMGGMECLRAMRSHKGNPNVPVIVLTCHATKELVTSAGQLGVKSYLLKSRFSIEQLLQQVQAQLTLQPPTHDHSQKHELPAVRERTPTPTTTRVSPSISIDAIAPLTNKSRVMAKLEQAGELKGFSPVASEVLRLTESRTCSVDQIAKLIASDHALALKILKLSNSAIYSRGESVDSVAKAVLRIGMHEIRQAVLNIALVEHLATTPGQLLDSGQFWEHSIATGIIAADLAGHVEGVSADGAFAAGLLHDVGILLFAAELAEEYQQVWKTAHESNLPLEQVERRMLGCNHAEVMDGILRNWKFPKHLTTAIANHHLSLSTMRQKRSEECKQIALLTLADRLSHACLLGTSGSDALQPTEELCEMLGIDGERIARIVAEAREKTASIKLAMLAKGASEGWQPLVHNIKRTLNGIPKPQYFSVNSQTDAFRICVDQLWEQPSDLKHAAILHICNGREVVELCNQLRKLQTDSDAHWVNALIIADLPTIDHDKVPWPFHTVVRMNAPVSISQLVATISSLSAAEQKRAAA